jgi:hypothetical protein
MTLAAMTNAIKGDFMKRLRGRPIVAALSIPAVVACATLDPREPGDSRCNGQRTVVVGNYWNRAVDVYASTGGILGIVDPGRREEFVLPEPARYAYARSSYRRGPQRVPRSYVQFRYLCR